MQIFDLYSTKEEALDFLDRLSSYSDALFSVKDKDKAWDKYFTKEEQRALLEVGKGMWEDGSQVKKLLTKLQEMVQKLPKVYLTVALKPTVLIADHIKQKLSQVLKGVFFLEFTIDENIIAGAILSYQGVQKDYSVRRNLELGT